jgi:hypothetical protein
VSAKEKARPEATEYATLDENTWWHSGLVWLPDLNENEENQKQKSNYK